MFCDRSRHGLGNLLNRFIRESNHDPAMLIEVSFTFQVRLLDDVVVATIDLDNQSPLNTREICKERSDWMLPSEFELAELLCPKNAPKQSFRLRLLSTERS